MKGNEIRELSCAGCGAPLETSSTDLDVLCAACGKHHVSIPPPPEVSASPQIGPGDAVAVKWGEKWWPARVLKAIGPDIYRVHFDGWGPAKDEVVGIDRLRTIDHTQRSRTRQERELLDEATPRKGIRRRIERASLGAKVIMGAALGALSFVIGYTAVDMLGGGSSSASSEIDITSLNIGDTVQVFSDGEWYNATVKLIDDEGQVKVGFVGYGNEWDEMVTEERMRSLPADYVENPAVAGIHNNPGGSRPLGPNEQLSVGQIVDVLWGQSWYPGRVISLTGDGKVGIHYEGWDTNSDEVVSRDRIRIPQ